MFFNKPVFFFQLWPRSIHNEVKEANAIFYPVHHSTKTQTRLEQKQVCLYNICYDMPCGSQSLHLRNGISWDCTYTSVRFVIYSTQGGQQRPGSESKPCRNSRHALLFPASAGHPREPPGAPWYSGLWQDRCDMPWGQLFHIGTEWKDTEINQRVLLCCFWNYLEGKPFKRLSLHHTIYSLKASSDYGNNNNKSTHKLEVPFFQMLSWKRCSDEASLAVSVIDFGHFLLA